MRSLHFICMLILALACVLPAGALAANHGFERWLAEFSARAEQAGVSKQILSQTLSGMKVDAQVIRLDRKQPEGKISFTQYKKNIVSAERIRLGYQHYHTHRKLLQQISTHYGVPAPMILALWGIETNYGSFTGNSDVVRSLATLAYEGRRAQFFEDQLLTLLTLIQQGDIKNARPSGSWAGAMGHCQFMPSSFERYAVDWDKDGVKDIWRSLPDVFASIANYLKTEGWTHQTGWGRAVTLPEHVNLVHEDLYRPLSHEALGARGIDVPAFEGSAYLMHPGTKAEGAFIVYQNYHTLLHWNKSRYFATAAGLLADEIAK